MKYHIVPVTSFNQNCSIIWCEISNEAVLVDPGGNVEKLCKIIRDLKVKIKKIVLTHGHIDHIQEANTFRKHYKVPIIGPHKGDQFLLNDLVTQCQLLGFSKPTDSSIIPDMWLQDEDIIQIGYEVFTVLHCPGHSPGHIVLWNKSSKFIVMGDVLFKNNIGRSDFPGGDFLTLIKTIKYKLILLGDDITFLPGHGEMSSIGNERKNNPFLR